MTQHEHLLRLRHMLEATAEAIDLARGRDMLSLSEDRVLQLALARLVEIVGEAASRVPALKKGG